ncbi:alpha/beta hydrolase [Metabacillus litoralis]|uniref:alpha/beta hydrolase n=1 Tax=Metabacillus litoralis TaxID=152268 RepID=UPI000EF5810F|nr:alpha/beta hydrolase [Metabacillus litoralis]
MAYFLWSGSPPFFKEEDEETLPSLTPYLVKESVNRGAIIICPGGGYQRRANHEGEPVAKWLNTLGISAFVVNYRVSPNKHPAPLADAQRAIRVVRFYSEEWSLDKEKIGILGFSAGGHLAASVSTLSTFCSYEPSDQIDLESSQPDIAILCYPVISLLENYHEGSLHNLLGDHSTKKLRTLLSAELNVSSKTPPTFLWHTSDDASVSVENSLLYAKALSKSNIPYEMHIFPNGRHGLGLAEDDQIVGQWKKLCEKWLKKQGY